MELGSRYLLSLLGSWIDTLKVLRAKSCDRRRRRTRSDREAFPEGRGALRPGVMFQIVSRP